jgi:UDP-N-acetylglucosamine--N-acetylmuramyl-(pentapeptide) pyrophosphoryl-undecaprenol N-acetylglucosamine transferase
VSVYALCGGGTAGHITPLIAVYEQLRALDPSAEFVVIGTEGGRERELLPPALDDIVAVPRLPFPRKPSGYALSFIPRWIRTVGTLAWTLRERRVDAVVGFGGYTAAPAYLAARIAGIPLVVHEANALPGMANRLASFMTSHVAVCFPGTPLRHARVVGMPLRSAIVEAHSVTTSDARKHFGLSVRKPLLLVTGGSTGAQSINRTIEACRADLVGAGWQVLHLIGRDNDVPQDNPGDFVSLEYTDRMDLALAAADLVISRAGAATVSELEVMGKPTVFVPYHVGNGEQQKNAAHAVAAGGAMVVSNAQFTPEWVRSELLALMANSPHRKSMAESMSRLGVRDGAHQVAAMARDAVKGG